MSKWNTFLKNNLSIISDSKFTLKKNLGRFRKKINNHWHKIPILPVTSSLKSIFNKNNQQKNIFGSRIHLGSIGRLVWQKDYELLIRVFEKLRKRSNKEIGSSLETDITVYLGKEYLKLCKDFNLSEYFITSKAEAKKISTDSNFFKLGEIEDINVLVKKAEGEKCPRCWKIFNEPCVRCNAKN